MPSLPLSFSRCPLNLHVLFLSSPEDICDDPVRDVSAYAGSDPVRDVPASAESDPVRDVPGVCGE